MKKIITLLSLIWIGSTASAAELWCEGKVSRVLTYAEGEVMILSAWRGDWTVICNLETPRGGVPVGVCKNWFSQISAAVLADRGVIIHYRDVGSTPSCASLPTYGGAYAPGYVSLKQ